MLDQISRGINETAGIYRSFSEGYIEEGANFLPAHTLVLYLYTSTRLQYRCLQYPYIIGQITMAADWI